MTQSTQNSDTPVLGVYNAHGRAEQAVKTLRRAGFDIRKLSIVGKGYHSEEYPLGFFTAGDRIKVWGGTGAFWGSLWGMLAGAAFFWLPGIGALGVAGPFVHILVSALEGAAVVGGVGALGGALASMGIPKDSILKYERQIKADNYLLIVHGTADEQRRAREILRTAEDSEVPGAAA
jgi:hypothetical protein